MATVANVVDGVIVTLSDVLAVAGGAETVHAMVVGSAAQDVSTSPAGRAVVVVVAVGLISASAETALSGAASVVRIVV